MQSPIVPDCVRINGSNLPQAVAATCGLCVYWEDPGLFDLRGGELFRRTWVDRKREWFEKTWQEWGGCGFLALVSGSPAGYVQYAPARLFPGFYEYDYGMERPPDDEVLVSCLHVPVSFRGFGIGRRLLGRVVDDARGRELGPVWTYARIDSADNPSGPLDLYLRSGFVEVATSVREEGPCFAWVIYASG
jgi:GNAT superfamily N-acetyltransferase